MSRAGQLELLKIRSVVSRETVERLEVFEALLQKWQKIKNLVGPSTLNVLWRRHFADSLQLLEHAGNARTWADLGTGAGFPGLVIAIALTEIPNAQILLVESDHRKCAFLREVTRETGAPAVIIHDRIENAVAELGAVEIVTARALAPLPKLLEYAAPLLKSGATGLFLKGQDIAFELTQAAIFSRLELEFLPSRTDALARIVSARWRSSDRLVDPS